MKNYFKLTCIAVSIIASSCIKEGFDNENCVEDYNITIVWPDKNEHSDYDKNTTITIITPSGKVMTIKPGNPVELEAGKHELNGILGNDDDKVEIDGSTVTVKPNEDGTAGDPGDFMGGSTHIEIAPDGSITGGSTPDGNTRIEVPMIKQSRPLIIRVKLEGYGIESLTGISGTVEGIALARHINHGFMPVDGKPRHNALQEGNVSYGDMVQSEDGFYTESRRLLGIDGDASQQLNLTTQFANGTTLRFPFDITTDMDGFHITEVEQPWVIEIVLHLGADFSATIEDWKVGPEEWMTAH